MGNDDVAVDGDGCACADAGGDGDQLHVEDQLADDRPEDPVVQHRVGEGERHAKDGHDKVRDGQVDQEHPQIGPRSLPDREYDQNEEIPGDRQRCRECIQRDQHALGFHGQRRCDVGVEYRIVVVQ